ncbi:DUF2079 domain-containing protein [Sporichthya polymorpha]|uniref:DUF2079 domain-containing protein n=1 Tax=Sporichthya polymorpha TaxID=35751 RepID=UPI00036BE5DF|nr:DUF2079 domain-containing protein [Sporichthya polymorpha]
MATEAQTAHSTGLPRQPHPDPPTPDSGARASGGTAWTWFLAAGLFALYAVVSVRLHQRVRTTGFDLGIVEQAVRGFASGGAPIVEVEGPDANLLGDHFSPAYAALAPLYRVFPSPVTILLAQAFLLAIAVVPIARYAQQVLGRSAAVVVGLGYGLSWGIAEAVGFDAHEVMFAVPLMAGSVVALAERRLRAAVLWALPLLLVKEDLGLTVAAVGALVAWFGARRLGLATVVGGLAGTAVEVFWLLPANTPAGTFSAWWGSHRRSDDSGGLDAHLERVTVGLFEHEPKVVLLILLVAPTAMVALRSPLLLLVLPTLAWRLTSDNALYWGTSYHYSAVLMPVVFVAFVDGLRRLRAHQGPARIPEALAISAVVTALLVPAHPLWSAVRPSTWTADPRAADARAVLAPIPDDAQVQASNRLVPQLTSRAAVSVFGSPLSRANPEWIAVDRSDPVNWPFDSLADQEEFTELAREMGYGVVLERGEFVLLRRSTDDPRQFPPPPEPVPAPAEAG